MRGQFVSSRDYLEMDMSREAPALAATSVKSSLEDTTAGFREATADEHLKW